MSKNNLFIVAIALLFINSIIGNETNFQIKNNQLIIEGPNNTVLSTSPCIYKNRDTVSMLARINDWLVDGDSLELNSYEEYNYDNWKNITFEGAYFIGISGHGMVLNHSNTYLYDNLQRVTRKSTLYQIDIEGNQQSRTIEYYYQGETIMIDSIITKNLEPMLNIVVTDEDVYTYSNDERINTIIQYSKSNNYEDAIYALNHKDVFTYSEGYEKVERFYYVNNEAFILGRTIETYFEGNITREVTASTQASGSYGFVSKTEQEYNQNNQLIEYRTYSFINNEIWDLDSYYTYEYGNNDQLIRKSFYSSVLSSFDFFLRIVYEYTYNDNSQLISIDKVNYDYSDLNTVSSQHKYEYLYEQYTNSPDVLVTHAVEFNLSAYPNPFNPETTISFMLDKASHVTIDIFNIKGQLIKTVANDKFNTGHNSVVWNGTDSNNANVASGVYLYKVRSGKRSETRKIILMK